MKVVIDKKTVRYAVLGVMGCVVLYWVLNETSSVMKIISFVLGLFQPFLVGACLAFMMNVPVRAIESGLKKIPGIRGTRMLAIFLTILLLLLVIVIVVCMLVPQIVASVTTLGHQIFPFLERCESFLVEYLDDNPYILEWLGENTNFEEYDWASIAQQAIDVAGQSIKTIFSGAVSAVGSVVSAVWGVFVSIVFSLYSLSRKETLARQGRMLLYSFLPEKWADEVIRVCRLTNSTFSNFLSGQCLEVCILGSMFAISMTIFRMPYVALVSVLVAVTAFIPVVGAWIGCVFGAFFILVNDPMQAVWFVVMFLILQQIENNLIYPRVVGTSIGLPSMWVLVSVTIGGDLMGVAGMIVMIPAVSVIYTLLREYSGRAVRARNIDPEKLKAQPPELKSKFKEKREQSQKRREAKRAAQLAEMMKKSFHVPERQEEVNPNKEE